MNVSLYNPNICRCRPPPLSSGREKLPRSCNFQRLKPSLRSEEQLLPLSQPSRIMSKMQRNKESLYHSVLASKREREREREREWSTGETDASSCQRRVEEHRRGSHEQPHHAPRAPRALERGEREREIPMYLALASKSKYIGNVIILSSTRSGANHWDAEAARLRVFCLDKFPRQGAQGFS